MTQLISDRDVQELFKLASDEINHIRGSKVLTCNSASHACDCTVCKADAALRDAHSDMVIWRNPIAGVELENPVTQRMLLGTIASIFPAIEALQHGNGYGCAYGSNSCAYCYELASAQCAFKYLSALRRYV